MNASENILERWLFAVASDNLYMRILNENGATITELALLHSELAGMVLSSGEAARTLSRRDQLPKLLRDRNNRSARQKHDTEIALISR